MTRTQLPEKSLAQKKKRNVQSSSSLHGSPLLDSLVERVADIFERQSYFHILGVFLGPQPSSSRGADGPGCASCSAIMTVKSTGDRGACAPRAELD